MKVKAALVVLLGLIFLTFTQVRAEGFGEMWSERVRGPLVAEMKAVDPTIYGDYLLVVGGRGNKLMVFKLDTGDLLWEQNLSATIIAPPVVVNVSKETLVVVLTSTNDLFAMDLLNGNVRIKELKLGVKLINSKSVVMGDSLVVPTYKGALLVNLRTQKIVDRLELNYTVRSFVYRGNLYFIGEKVISAYDYDKGFNLIWSKYFDKRILSWGFSSEHGIFVLEDMSLVSLGLKNGEEEARVEREALGIPEVSLAPGTISVGELAHIAFKDGTLLYMDPSTLRVIAKRKTFKVPVYQPITVGTAIAYLSKDGNLTLYDYRSTRVLLRMPFKGIPSSNIVLTEMNNSYYATFVDRSGLLRTLSIPKHIPVVSISEKDGKYVVDGYLCRIETEGEPAAMGYYVMAPDGAVIEEKPNLGSVKPGACGSKFSLEIPGPFLLGVVFNGTREYPIHRVGTEALPPVTQTTQPTPTQTQQPAPKVKVEIPDRVNVGGYLVIRVIGPNVWKVDELTVSVNGPNVEKVSNTFKVGDQLGVQVKARAIKSGKGEVRVELSSDGKLLNVTKKQVEFLGEIASVNIPKQVSFGEQFVVRITIINEVKDGGNFTVKVSLDGQKSTTNVGALKLGEKRNVDLTLKANKEGLLNLMVQVLVDGETVYSRSFGVSVKRQAPPAPATTRPRPVPPPAPVTGQQGMLPENLTSILEIVLAVVLVVGVILMLRRALVKPTKKKPIKTPIEAPPIEVSTEGLAPSVEEESFELIPEEPREEIEAPEEVPMEEERGFEEFRLEPVETSKATPPEAEEFKVPEVEVEELTPPTEYLPPPIDEEVVELMDKAKRKLSSVKIKLAELEDILGFEAAPYKLTDVESKIMNAEMAYKAKDMKKAKNLLEDALEDLTSLEKEVDEAKKALVDGWGSVESRIEVMLKVWGRAPANMLTMVPPGFRIIALERYRRMHEDKKLELRGDELYLVE